MDTSPIARHPSVKLTHQKAYRSVLAKSSLIHLKRTGKVPPSDHLTSTPIYTILLIDDNAIQAATRQTILKRAGYFVIAALSSQRALEQLRAGDFADEVKLVVTDHIMPGLNGSAFVHALRETHPKLPVLVISGLMEAEAEYANLNVIFRLKPLPPDSLLATVYSMLRRPEEGEDELTAAAV
jgi:DNA-binding NtrC family response regulator